MPTGLHHHGEECRRIFALLSEYLDAELPAETCDEIEAHLSDCPPCLEFLESLRRTVELCRTFQPGEMPGPLSEQVRSELRQLYEKALRGTTGGCPG
jgi:RNA polymerase sigma-70 factor (ECF subfamily)